MAARVQREDFDLAAELKALTAGDHRIGGLASFVGLVRDMADLGAGGGVLFEVLCTCLQVGLQ